MRTLLFLSAFILPFWAGSAFAQQHLDVRQYNNTYEIKIYKDGGKTENKCQAVRLAKDWFITAAHCVVPVCNSNCIITVKMANTPSYELTMDTKHEGSSKAVFLHSKSKEDQVSYDIALLKFAPEKTTYYFKDKKNFTLLTKQEAFAKLTPAQQTEFKEAIDGVNFPVILELKTETPKILKRILAVASVWDYDKNILSSYDYVFFSPAKNWLYTDNFGIRQGISGSGVMAGTGELVAIVSAVAHMQRTISDGYTSQKKDVNFSMFSTFDDSVLSFLKSHIPGLTVKKAGFNYFGVVPDEYRAMTDNVEAM